MLPNQDPPAEAAPFRHAGSDRSRFHAGHLD